MAVTTVSITGSVIDPHGVGLVKGTINARLSATGSVLDGAVSQRVAGEAQATVTAGTIAGLALVPNDAITPSGTHYLVVIDGTLSNGRRGRWTERWQVPSGGALDIGSVPRLDVVPGVAVSTVEAVQASVLAAATASQVAAAASESMAAASEADSAASALAAQAARDAALIQSGVYADEPTGRAAVADGVAFKVQGSGDVAAYEYRRVNSGSSTLIATYPASAAVAGLKKTMAQPSAGTSTDHLVVSDPTGNVLLRMDQSAAVLLHGMVGSVQSRARLVGPASSSDVWQVADAAGNVVARIDSSGIFRAVSVAPRDERPLIVFDVDADSDCDDFAGIGSALQLHKDGVIEIAAFTVTTSNPYAAPAVYACLQYYGLETAIKIGAYQGSDLDNGYARQGVTNPAYAIANFFRAGDTRTNYDDSASVLRSALMVANRKVTISTGGFAKTLADVLALPASGRYPSGSDLIADKVGTLQALAGYYPSTAAWASTYPTNVPEFNIAQDKASWVALAAGWPTPIWWMGAELGFNLTNVPSVLSNPNTNPITKAFQVWNAGAPRNAWQDLLNLAAAFPIGTYLTLAAGAGTNAINPSTGYNTFTASAVGVDRYFAASASYATMQAVVRSLLAKTP